MISGHENKLILRRHTAATEALSMNDASTWRLERGTGELSSIAIPRIVNPFPAVKSESGDVQCINGALDLTEAHGQVFYKNKTVEIDIQKLPAAADQFETMRETLAIMHGRLVDFAFDTSEDVEWYYTGRLSIDKVDEESNLITLKIETYPFLQSVQKTALDIPTETSLDRSTNGWSVASKPADASVGLDSGNTIVAYGSPGDVIQLQRSASASRYTIGITTLRGGEFRFTGGTSDRVRGFSEGGYLHAEITIDGSYYAWTTENGARVYKPCVLLSYILTELPDSGVMVLPSNSQIRPELFNLETCAADVLLDGKRIAIDRNSPGGVFTGAVLPGIRADRSSTNAACCITAVGNSLNDVPRCRIRWREEKLG